MSQLKEDLSFGMVLLSLITRIVALALANSLSLILFYSKIYTLVSNLVFSCVC